MFDSNQKTIRKKLPISVALISLNEEENLPRSLTAVADIVSEIILVDSHSTDRTREIAEQYGARVFERDWSGYVAQKNFALEQCSQPWILTIDCDEEITPQLKDEIVGIVERHAQIKQEPEVTGYLVRRKVFYLGKLMRFAWQPDWKMRLVHRAGNPKWSGQLVHESLKVQGKTEKMKSYLIHYSYKDLMDHFLRSVKYADLSAQSMLNKGKKFHWIKILFNPMINLIKFYFFRFAFLDGFRGFTAGVLHAGIYSFMKYALLREKQKIDLVKKSSPIS